MGSTSWQEISQRAASGGLSSRRLSIVKVKQNMCEMWSFSHIAYTITILTFWLASATVVAATIVISHRTRTLADLSCNKCKILLGWSWCALGVPSAASTTSVWSDTLNCSKLPTIQRLALFGKESLHYYICDTPCMGEAHSSMQHASHEVTMFVYCCCSCCVVDDKCQEVNLVKIFYRQIIV